MHFPKINLEFSKKVTIFAYERWNEMNEVDNFLNYLLSDRGYSERTIRTYEASLTSFETFYQHLDELLTWQTIDADVVRQWMANEMKRGNDARTVAKELSALRSFYKYLLRMGKIEKSPMYRIQNPKASQKLPTFLRQKEVNQLFDDVTFPDNYEGKRDYCMLMTFYHTGIRLSELIGLNVADVNLERNELKVTGKRNKQRIIPFGEELHKELVSYLSCLAVLGEVEDDALFLGPKKKRISVSQVEKTVHHYLSLVTTQKKKSPHVLRHTFATAMLNNGADLEAIKELLGHESVTTTEVYTHTTFADLEKEYKLAHPRA